MVYFDSVNKKSDIIFICVDNTQLIQNDEHRTIIKNIADYSISNICSKGYDLINTLDVNQVLPTITKKYSHAVVFDADTEFLGSIFFNQLTELCSKDFFLAGHVLDRHEGYFELHSQCYVINLKKYAQYNMPNITQIQMNATHEHLEPIRSVENYHDEYTPLWIKSGTVKKQYQHKWHGNEILSMALENQENVLIFDPIIRNSKRCYYAQYEEDFIKNSEFIHDRYKFAKNKLFYPINTEEPQQLQIAGPIMQLITPASGLNWLFYLHKYGYTDNTLISFYDHNENALRYIKNIVEKFKGKDYYSFLKSVMPTNTNDWINSKEEIDLHFDKIKHLWHIVEHLHFSFHHCDILKNFSVPVINDHNTIVNLSNVFCYEPNAAFVSLTQRINAENNLINYLKKHKEKISLILSDHAWSGLVHYNKLTGRVTDFMEQKVNSCLKATWYIKDFEQNTQHLNTTGLYK